MKKLLFFVILVFVFFLGYRWQSSPALEEAPELPDLPSIVIEGEEPVQLEPYIENVPDNAIHAPAEAMRVGVGVTENEFIRVTSPTPDVLVSSPFAVAGEARVFEGTVQVRVKNFSGDTLIRETATAHASDADAFGSFSVNLSYQFSNTKEGVVEVFSQSAKDGTEEHLIRIPVRFE